MTKVSPKTLPQFRALLEATMEELTHMCDRGNAESGDELKVAQIVNKACRSACRFGLGKVLGEEHKFLSPIDGLAALGAIHSRVLDRLVQPAGLMSDQEVGEMLGISRRSVWRRNSAGEIPAPIKVGGLTKWRRVEIEAMIEG